MNHCTRNKQCEKNKELEPLPKEQVVCEEIVSFTSRPEHEPVYQFPTKTDTVGGRQRNYYIVGTARTQSKVTYVLKPRHDSRRSPTVFYTKKMLPT